MHSPQADTYPPSSPRARQAPSTCGPPRLNNLPAMPPTTPNGHKTCRKTFPTSLTRRMMARVSPVPCSPPPMCYSVFRPVSQHLASIQASYLFPSLTLPLVVFSSSSRPSVPTPVPSYSPTPASDLGEFILLGPTRAFLSPDALFVSSRVICDEAPQVGSVVIQTTLPSRKTIHCVFHRVCLLTFSRVNHCFLSWHRHAASSKLLLPSAYPGAPIEISIQAIASMDLRSI
jgi:hypothetical protein